MEWPGPRPKPDTHIVPHHQITVLLPSELERRGKGMQPHERITDALHRKVAEPAT